MPKIYFLSFYTEGPDIDGCFDLRQKSEEIKERSEEAKKIDEESFFKSKKAQEIGRASCRERV